MFEKHTFSVGDIHLGLPPSRLSFVSGSSVSAFLSLRAFRLGAIRLGDIILRGIRLGGIRLGFPPCWGRPSRGHPSRGHPSQWHPSRWYPSRGHPWNQVNKIYVIMFSQSNLADVQNVSYIKNRLIKTTKKQVLINNIVNSSGYSSIIQIISYQKTCFACHPILHTHQYTPSQPDTHPHTTAVINKIHKSLDPYTPFKANQ